MANFNAINVSTEEVNQIATNIERINGELRDYLNAIKNKMNGLEMHFDSRSGDTIRQKMNDLNPTFEKYQEAVAGYVAFLREVATNFEATEQTAQKNASAFK